MSQGPVLLTDDQVSRFITDGFLILRADVPAEVHECIDERLLWLLHKEENPGNNVLPVVPEMYEILNCPVVSGALASVLGHDYVLHPHRFVHNNEPGKIVDGAPKVGEGSRSFVGWHQDDHSPLSRPRHHYPRYAMILYYPQDTPLELGPTQLIPATQLYTSFTQQDQDRGIQAAGPAGTCVLVHFDLVHGGSLNVGARTRNMAKFVFCRCSEPTAPSWDNWRTEWQTPKGHLAPVENAVVWRHHWEWMSGRVPGPSTGSWLLCDTTMLDVIRTGTDQLKMDVANQLGTSSDRAVIEAIVDDMTEYQGEIVRQSYLYNLAQSGEAAVEKLCRELAYVVCLADSGIGGQGWQEGAVVMEDPAYALAAMGEPAVAALIELLLNESEWLRINAAFALGEMGAAARTAMKDLIGLLRDDSHAVVRTTLDAIGQIRIGSRAALPEIERLLASPPESFPITWTAKQRRNWTALSQVRVNAVMCLLRMGPEANGAELWFGKYLDDDCGYVGGFGVEFLMRRNTAAAKEIALEYLYRHRWDSSLRGGMRTF